MENRRKVQIKAWLSLPLLFFPSTVSICSPLRFLLIFQYWLKKKLPAARSEVVATLTAKSSTPPSWHMTRSLWTRVFSHQTKQIPVSIKTPSVTTPGFSPGNGLKPGARSLSSAHVLFQQWGLSQWMSERRWVLVAHSAAWQRDALFRERLASPPLSISPGLYG